MSSIYIKEFFVNLNTPIPSSAPVERLFSQSNVVFASKCNQLEDGLLEILILSKIHKKCNLLRNSIDGIMQIDLSF